MQFLCFIEYRAELEWFLPKYLSAAVDVVPLFGL